MKIKANLAEQIVDGDSDDWSEVSDTRKITGKSRWSLNYTSVFFSKSDEKFYLFYWRMPATEMQEETMFGSNEEVEITEVRKVPKMTTVWEPVA